MRLFSHSEKCQSFVYSTRLAFIVFILCTSSFALTASEDRYESKNSSIESLLEIEKPTINDGNYFVLEEIPGKYKLFKAVVNGKEIILRPGRIEMFLNPSLSEESSYLIFDGSNENIHPVGIQAISESQEEISNLAMAEVLNEKYITKTIFDKVVYKGLYSGLDLELTMGKNGVKATLIATENQSVATDLKMRLISADKLESSGKSIHLGKSNQQNTVEIISKYNDCKITNSNNILISPNADSIENLTFDIILK